MASSTIVVQAEGFEAFTRFIQFASNVVDYARAHDDAELLALVERLRDDTAAARDESFARFEALGDETPWPWADFPPE